MEGINMKTYEMLKEGEEITRGVEFRPNSRQQWRPAYATGQVSSQGVGLYRRKVTQSAISPIVND